MDLKALKILVEQIAQEKNIPAEKVREVLEQALAAAYKKEYGHKGYKIESKIDPRTGQADFWQVLSVVNQDMIYSEQELAKLAESELALLEQEQHIAPLEGEPPKKVRFNPERHVQVEQAKAIDPGAEAGQEVRIKLESKQDFGRIATQTAKQVILQKLREAERDAVFAEYHDKEGELVSGVVQRVEELAVHFDLGKGIGTMARSESIPGEFYRPGQRLKLYVLKVDQDARGPRILLSRAYPKMVSKLFELEVPEITSGQIEIKAIAREPGSRSKIAVASNADGLDPVGSCIGQKGSRVGAVISELGGEKIDIVQYAKDNGEFISNALSPAKVEKIDLHEHNRALCWVDRNQLSLAIGREGQNVRLAAQLTGWKIDVQASGQEPEPKPVVEPEQEPGPQQVQPAAAATSEAASSPVAEQVAAPQAPSAEPAPKKCVAKKRKPAK